MIYRLKLIRAVTVSQSIGFYLPLVSKLQSKGYEVVSLSSPGPELQKLRNQGVRCIEIPMERHISLKNDFISLCRLIRTFHKEKPDIIHSMTPKAGMLCMVAAWICRVPVRIHTFTGLVWPTSSGLKRRILMATDWLTCACSTHIIPEGEGVKSDLLNHGITQKPLKVLGYGNVRGIDLVHYDRTAEVMGEAERIKKEVLNAGIPSDDMPKGEEIFTFIFIGRIVRDKGINELVSAFRKLQMAHPQVRLLLVGEYEEDLDPILPETKREIDENPGILAVGRQNDVRPWLAASDALVFPSYREGFPNVVIEAGAMGLPSIVTDINGSREIIEEGQNGIIIPSKDEEALYDGMLRFAEQPQLVSSLSSHARELVAKRYEQGFVQKCLLDFYRDVDVMSK